MKPDTADVAHIPEKTYFRIGEVSSIVGVEPYVLRYWESEFVVTRPVRGKSRQRLYRRRDVEMLLTIKDLLHCQGYTIAGAQKMVQPNAYISRRSEHPLMTAPHHTEVPPQGILEQIKQELTTLLHLLWADENMKK